MPAADLTGPAANITDSQDLITSSREQGPEWRQFNLHFVDWENAERTAAVHLAPLLEDATGTSGAWWFIRKYPVWRLRLTSNPGAAPPRRLTQALDKMVSQGVLERWQTGRYEPETAAFGGTEAMAAAHRLFAADSRAILRPSPGLPLGRREVSMLLCGALMRGAGLEPYEIGDVWAKITHDRPLPADEPPGRLTRLTGTVTTLLHTDTTPTGAAFGPTGPLAAAAPWAEAFHTCGKTLADLARDGLLERGLRGILAYHVIFHWNRAGLQARQQSLLAHAARAAILGPTPQRKATSQPATTSRPKPPSNSPGLPTRLSRVLRRLPLVPRPHLICPPLPDRVRAVRGHADAAAAATDPDERIDHACRAWNLAALIAADCGLPGLAADLSWQQFQLLRRGWPLNGRTAIAALQPLVNLARLHGRARRPERMHQVLTAIGHALDHGGSVLLHDTNVTLANLTTAEGTTHVRNWYRHVLAQDGTRALATTGDWAKAAAHAALHDPAPHRLREARQTRILALALAGHHDDALNLLESTDPADLNSPVAALLRVLLDAHAGRTDHRHITQLASVFTAAEIEDAPKPSQNDTDDGPGILFQVRLAHAATNLGAAPNISGWNHLADRTLQIGDAYAAREALATPACRTALTADRVRALTDLVLRAALSTSTPPTSLLPNLASLSEPLQLAGNFLART